MLQRMGAKYLMIGQKSNVSVCIPLVAKSTTSIIMRAYIYIHTELMMQQTTLDYIYPESRHIIAIL